MERFRKFLVATTLVATSLQSEPISPHLIYYHLSQNRIEKSIELYQERYKETGRHDAEFLEDLSMYLLKQGISSEIAEEQLLSLYGVSFGSTSNAITLCDLAMRKKNPLVELAAIHLLGQLQDDRCEEILVRAFSSQHLQIRFEAGFQLALRKARTATGLFQSLMHHLPEDFYVYFPDLFALVGTHDALSQLQKLLMHRHKPVVIASLLAIANHRRDDFLPFVRSVLTHKDPSEQEAALNAVAKLHDLSSLPHVRALANSPDKAVRLAALSCLAALGDHTVYTKLQQEALSRDPFSISLLKNVPGSQDILFSLLYDKDRTTQFNAAIALLHHRDPRCVPTLLEIVLPIHADYGIYPITSQGGSLTSWKIVPSKEMFDKVMNTNLSQITLSLREYLLTESAQLSEITFINIAKRIFDLKQSDLVPLTVHLLESIGSKDVIALLKEESERAGAPLVRDYCRLALFRLGESSESALHGWLSSKKEAPLIRFRPLLSWADKAEESSSYLLTPEEESRLYVETVSTIASSHSADGILLLLDLIAHGNPQNKYALAGLLLQSIQ